MVITEAAKNKFENIGGFIKYSLLNATDDGLVGIWESIDEVCIETDCVIWRSCEAGTNGGAEQGDCDNVFVIERSSLEHDIKLIDYDHDGLNGPNFKVELNLIKDKVGEGEDSHTIWKCKCGAEHSYHLDRLGFGYKEEILKDHYNDRL
jgi:hypothetical protein